MSPTLRNIAIAIALLGLGYYGYKQQLHLPTYVNPFDDQWEMSVPWLRNNHDAIVQGPCNHFYYEISHSTYRIGYAILDGYEDIVTGKTLSVLADTVELHRSSYRPGSWGLSAKY